MNGSSGSNERVTFITEDRTYLPQVMKGGTPRDFLPEDMPRVLDFEGAIVAPPDGSLMYGLEDETDFQSYHFCLRGGFLFYFNKEDVDETSGPYVTYHNSPRGVVPLEGVSVEYPPGGRRVFREHAQTNAKSGYEFVMLHTANVDDPRPPCFVIADSLGKREKWAAAIRSRADASTPTLMRTGYSSSTTRRAAPAVTAKDAEPKKSLQKAEEQADQAPKHGKRSTSSSLQQGKTKETKSVQKKVMEVSDDAELASAVLEFGVAQFDESEWMNRYFAHHNDSDAAEKCKQMERFQMEMKRDLKGAVLEQYEYFVQASGEMTTMGREVASLKNLIEKQADVLKEMQTLEFLGNSVPAGDEIMGRSDDESGDPSALLDGEQASFTKKGMDERSFFSDMSSLETGNTQTARSNEAEQDEDDAPPIQVPEWLQDSVEEISAIIREGRYTDAVELLLKSKAEISELLDRHERPTAYRLKKEQKDDLRSKQRSLNSLNQRLTNRITESLRRKNEALRQGLKRDRTDASGLRMLSPCALKDDELFLQLLVKMGRNKEAAEAFAARRSLLLIETLNERPISGAGTVDLVIYAAQLSQSFFSCLAGAVEGFLDLFLSPPPTSNAERGEEDISLDASSLHSHASSKNLPAGAVASVVLWCDAELAKFAAAFGGARVLSNLSLNPPSQGNAQPRVVGAKDTEKDRKSALELAAQCIDQAFMYASSNLDSVGLPLTPRLAECIRVRLRGCEGEISCVLDKRWQHLTADWRMMHEDGGNFGY